jgi:hypothetical protein
MKRIQSLTELSPYEAPHDPEERANYVAALRDRYLEGTLDEVLIPKKVRVPDRLMWVLFPHLFPSPNPMVNAPLCAVDLDSVS